MIYQGYYYSDHIYGTSNNNKVKVQTTAGANFLSCELEVVFNSQEWSHTFEIPFFNNKAEFYFENYIHSIITQKFSIQNIDFDNYKFYDFDLASVSMKLKEMQQNTVLSDLEHNFYMILGKFDALSIDYLNSGVKRILPIVQTHFLTEKGLLSFSFLSTNYPNKLLINNGFFESHITLPSLSTLRKLHAITIPIKNIVSSISTALTLTLKFSNGASFDLGQFNIIDHGIDHNSLVFQNNYGTISTIELTGEFKTAQQYKSDFFNYVNDNHLFLNSTKIDVKKSYALNTGYLLDSNKYEMLYILLKSFNIFLVDSGLKKMILSSSQKLMPYKSNYYLNNETLKFKLSKNDDIHYRIF